MRLKRDISIHPWSATKKISRLQCSNAVGSALSSSTSGIVIDGTGDRCRAAQPGYRRQPADVVWSQRDPRRVKPRSAIPPIEAGQVPVSLCRYTAKWSCTLRYRHPTLEQRYQIAALFKAGFAQREIAEEIGLHPSTVGRELRRNRCGKHYIGSIAHGYAKRRRRAASARAHLPETVRLELLARLQEKHSPEQISGRWTLLRAGQVSHTTVYRYARQLGLRHHLRHPGQRVRPRYRAGAVSGRKDLLPERAPKH